MKVNNGILEETESTQISKANKQDYILILEKKKGVKYKTLQVRFTLIKSGVWKREKVNLCPFDIAPLFLFSWNTENKTSSNCVNI